MSVPSVRCLLYIDVARITCVAYFLGKPQAITFVIFDVACIIYEIILLVWIFLFKVVGKTVIYFYIFVIPDLFNSLP
jgi:hypothetical protein